MYSTHTIKVKVKSKSKYSPTKYFRDMRRRCDLRSSWFISCQKLDDEREWIIKPYYYPDYLKRRPIVGEYITTLFSDKNILYITW